MFFAGESPRPTRAWPSGLRRSAATIVTLLAVTLGWIILTSVVDSIYLPPLSSILDAFQTHWLGAGFREDLLPSLRRLIMGFLLGGVVGVVIGLALGASWPARAMFEPVLHFARAIPGPVVVLILLALLGISDAGKIAAIAIASFFPVVMNTIAGYQAVDRGLRDVSVAFSLSRRQWVRFGLLPAVAPQVAVGLRVSLAIAFIVMIVSEYIGATNGIGYFTNTAASSFEFSEMWSGVILLALIGTLSNSIFVAIEKRIIFWTETSGE